MIVELKKDLDYVVLVSDPHGDAHGKGRIEQIRQDSVRLLALTAQYINERPEIIAWLNTGDIDDIYEAINGSVQGGKLNLDQFIQGNAAVYKAMNEVYKNCRLKREQKLVVLGNHDIPMTFLQTVEHCTLVGADIAEIAENYLQGTQGKIKIKPAITLAGEINGIPIIGAMNTTELPPNVPKEIGKELFPHLAAPFKQFYDAYFEIYAEQLKGKYYVMAHKGLIDKQDGFRKKEDAIHKIALGSLASFEAHFHDGCGNIVGKTIRFRSGTNHILVIGLDKESGVPKHFLRKQIQ